MDQKKLGEDVQVMAVQQQTFYADQNDQV